MIHAHLKNVAELVNTVIDGSVVSRRRLQEQGDCPNTSVNPSPQFSLHESSLNTTLGEPLAQAFDSVRTHSYNR